VFENISKSRLCAAAMSFPSALTWSAEGKANRVFRSSVIIPGMLKVMLGHINNWGLS